VSWACTLDEGNKRCTQNFLGRNLLESVQMEDQEGIGWILSK